MPPSALAVTGAGHAPAGELVPDLVRRMIEESAAAALGEARLPPGERIGLAAGLGLGDLEAGAEPPLTLHLLTERVAGGLGLEGPRTTFSATCASGLYALEQAAADLAFGRAGAMVVAGGERLGRFVSAGFSTLGLLSREGLVLGMAGAAAVVEDLEAARRRGARIRAVLLGRAIRSDATHLTAADESGRGMAAAVRAALAEAGLEPREVRLSSLTAHANPVYARMYLNVFREVFGEEAPEVVSWEGELGHVMAATATMALVHAARLFDQGARGPLLALTVGFGGHNGATVLVAPEDVP